MRKAARKEKKLAKLQRLAADPNQPKFISLNTTYQLLPQDHITIRVSDAPKDEFSKFEDVLRTQFNALGGAIAKSERLKAITCHGDAELVKYITEALKFNTSVDYLSISQTWFPTEELDDRFATLCAYFEEIFLQNRLKTFIFASPNESYVTNYFFGRFINGLRNNTCLTALHLPGATYTPDILGDLLQAIKSNPKIIDLTINTGFRIQADGAQYFRPLLAQNNLTRLIMDTSNTSTNGACFGLFSGLRENSSLTELSLAKKSYRTLSASFSDTECNILAEALGKHKTLTKLDISGNMLGSRNIAKILLALQNNQTLTEFLFFDNNINNYIAQTLGKLIEVNESITALDLVSAHLTHLACEFIGPALAKNRTITSLNLFMNYIGSEGCKYLAEGLKLNKGLIRLNLKDCKIDDKGCKYLGEAIKTNQCLMHLDLTGQVIKEEGFRALIDGLKENDALTDLAVSKDKKLPEHLHEEVISLQNKNKKYQQGLKINTITIMIQIGRSDAFDMFPLEIWLRIFKHFVSGGIPGFNHIAEAILMKYDVWDLKALCKMRIVTINGKGHLLPRK